MRLMGLNAVIVIPVKGHLMHYFCSINSFSPGPAETSPFIILLCLP